MPTHEADHPDDRDIVIVLRCDRCGDTFPQHQDEPVRCPTCGSVDAHEAHEPLL